MVEKIRINNLPENINRAIFWSYKEDAELPVEIAVEQVLIYGDIDEIKSFVKFIDNPEIIMNIYKNRVREKWKNKTPEFIRFFDLFLKNIINNVA